jgi:secondary thiamine-phosphate synthase enzyme
LRIDQEKQLITHSPYKPDPDLLELIQTNIISVKTKGESDIIDITSQVENLLERSKAKEGFMILFLQSTTSSLTIMEFEEGLLSDLPNALERLAPKNAEYQHEKAYADGNGHSHVRSSVVGVDITAPFSEGKLLLGTWQRIVLIEFDIRPRERHLVIQIVTA